MRKQRAVLLPSWRLRHRRINGLGLRGEKASTGTGGPGLNEDEDSFRPPWEEDEAPPCALRAQARRC